MLALATSSLVPERARGWVRLATYGLAVATVSALCWAGTELVRTDLEFGAVVAWGIPVWAVSLVMPASLLLVCAHHVWHAARGAAGRLAATSCALLPPR